MAKDSKYPIRKNMDRQVLARIAKSNKLKNPLLVDKTQATDPDTKKTYIKFTAVEERDGNGPRYHAIVDPLGRAVRTTPKLESLFRPPETFTLITPPVLAANAIVQPAQNILTLNPGDQFNETVTVTIPKDAAAPKADVYFLADTTGSINNVSLVPTAGAVGFIGSINPAGGYGPLEKDQEHTLTFEVQFVGKMPCRNVDQIFSGTLDVVADEVVIGAKPVRITVPACKRECVYSVKFICGTQDDCCSTCAPVTPGRYATEINIHNFSSKKVKVAKRIIPVVLAGAPIGREPRIAKARQGDAIVLPPHSATMDDCCRLSELLFGTQQTGAINIGFLEITSSDELAVTAVYTTTGSGGGVSIDVENVQPKG